jgi:dipeptide/tripeptide permease
MRYSQFGNLGNLPFGTTGLFAGPLLLGVIFISIGVLLIIWPELLALVVASVFIMIGVGLLSTAWASRERVRYRRMDQQWTDDFS